MFNDNGSKYPFELTLRWRYIVLVPELTNKRNVSSGDIMGELHWPTKGKATTQIVGKVTGNSVLFKELTVISGMLPCFAPLIINLGRSSVSLTSYTGTISGQSIKGQSDSGATYNLQYTQRVPSKYFYP